MRILILGGGGREHALIWHLKRFGPSRDLHAAPGNPGITRLATCHPISLGDPQAIASLAREVKADLVIAGPEAPLVAGAADACETLNIPFFGPTAAAAKLEGSKIFAKRFMEETGIPTARYAVADTPQNAKDALSDFPYPLVLKADGLAAGKGVIIVQDQDSALAAIADLMTGRHLGGAGGRIVIEEFLQGEELSYIGICDGHKFVPLRPTQDHKALHDGDEGPNTGGMGAYCDDRLLDDRTAGLIESAIIQPVLDRMEGMGTPFRGFLYAGLMMTADGPKVLEFNVRLGDPETQPLMCCLASDLTPLLLEAANAELDEHKLEWAPEAAVCIVAAAPGYPQNPTTGQVITGIENAERSGAFVFHAGITQSGDDLIASGGRVLGVAAADSTLAEAIDRAYDAIECIEFEGMHYRRDIGEKGLKRWED